MKIRDGACSLASLKSAAMILITVRSGFRYMLIVRTYFSESPSHLDINSDNGTK